MTCVVDNMDITWICRFCGAVNSASDSHCSDCSSIYSQAPSTCSQAPQGSATNQAFLNQGVVFNNSVFHPQPSVDEMLHSVEKLYNINESDLESETKDSLGMRVFTWSLNIVIWLSIIITGSIFLFFVVVVIAAFCMV